MAGGRRQRLVTLKVWAIPASSDPPRAVHHKTRGDQRRSLVPPPAKRLCELVMVSPGLRVGREVARELLFADLGPAASANALSRALSLAREALSALGEEVAGRLRADRANIWFSADGPLDIDLVAHEEALRSALAMEPGAPATRRSRWPWPKKESCSKTSPMRNGRYDPEKPSNCFAREPGWNSPGTTPGAVGAQGRRRS